MQDLKHGIRRSSAGYLGAATLIAIGALLGAQPASADTVSGNYCVQDNFGSKLNCTANDVNIAGVKEVNGVPVISPTTCTEGTTFDLTATFLLATTATQRYDIGITFATDGDPNHDGARTGTCARSDLPTGPTTQHFYDFDGDACGDTTSNDSPIEFTVTLPNVTCHDSDGDGKLNLPYIVSWGNSAGTVCNNAADALPQTSSKCKANDTFNVPVTVESPSSSMSKDASVEVTYTIQLNNSSSTLSLTVTGLTDSHYGNVLDSNNTNIASTNCTTQFSTAVPAGGSRSCWFKPPVFNSANQGSATAVADIVTATGTATAPNGATQSFTATSNERDVTVYIQ